MAGTALGRMALALGMTVSFAAGALAAEAREASFGPKMPWQDGVPEDTTTGKWFGVGETLEERGVTIKLDFTTVYQKVVKGGMEGQTGKGEDTGVYNLRLNVDLEKLISLPGARVYAKAKGGWSEGIDPQAVGSIFNMNSTAPGDQTILFRDLYYEQALLDRLFVIRAGRIDLTGGIECEPCTVAFDCNAFANDEYGQFLNGALVNNPTVPFPSVGLGAALVARPMAWLYFAGGVGDAAATGRSIDVDNAFDETFYVGETGILSKIPSPSGDLVGAYRIGAWYSPQSCERLDGSGGEVAGHAGWYASVDQMVWRENAKKGDTQGLGLFGRFGSADERVNEIKTFWSAGGQYQGLIPTRDDDVIAAGFATGRFSKDAGLSAQAESVAEAYYRFEVFKWLQVTPSIQYVWSPGGDKSVDDAVAFAIRAFILF